MELTQIQKEIVDTVPCNPIGRLLLSPRTGKTPVVLSLIKRDKPKNILWITPSAELAETIIPSEFVKFKASKFLKNLTTSTWKSLPKVEGHFDYIVLDEEQYLTENNLKTILNGKLTYKALISMTGTPTKSYLKNQILNGLNLPILYDISISEAVDLGLLANYQINIINVELSSLNTIEISTLKHRFKTSEKKQYDFVNRVTEKAIAERERNMKYKILMRMRLIYENQSKFQKAFSMFHSNQLKDHRKMIFCPTIKQATAMCKFTYHSKTDATHLIDFVNGKINSISMVNSGGIGFTYKEVDDLFLIQADSDVNGYTSQKICRALLKQADHFVTIWIFLLKGTKDEEWVKSALKNFNPENINDNYQF